MSESPPCDLQVTASARAQCRPYLRVVKGIFVTLDRPFFPVKCEMANFFLVIHDFHSSRGA